jgi:agmatinase
MFPGASANPDEADYVVVGAPLDASTTFEPGTRFGPREIRHYAQGFDDYDRHTGSCFTDLGVGDHGDVGPTDDVADYLDYLTGTLREHVDSGRHPLVLGGEHTVTIAGLRALDPDVYVCLDAHLDLYEAYAGNPLSHATVTHHAVDIADRVVVLGARAGSEDEWERAEDHAALEVVSPRAVGSWEPGLADETAYLSVDIDAADPGFAPGTGTKEPFGLTPRELHAVVRTVAPHAAGFDIVEVNDRDDGQAATLAAKLLRAFVYAHAAGT